MTARSSATDLHTEVVDLTSIPLSEIRTIRDSRLAHAVEQLIAKVRRGEYLESIQDQRSV